MSKRYDEPIEVEVDAPLPTGPTDIGDGDSPGPVAFKWRGRRYVVNRLIKRWREAGGGWDPARASDSECYRVESAGGIYDLLHDRLAGRKRPQWRLARVWD